MEKTVVINDVVAVPIEDWRDYELINEIVDDCPRDNFEAFVEELKVRLKAEGFCPSRVSTIDVHIMEQ